MLGRLPWLALERRMRALRFLVFLDIRLTTLQFQARPAPNGGLMGLYA